MKKLLLLAALSAAGLAQAHQNVGTSCGEYIKCEGSVREGQTFKCPDCVCPRVTCPIPAEVVCEARAVPVKTQVCPEKQMTCGTCHKVKAACGCKGGFNHRHHHEVMYVDQANETKQMRTPKRIQTRSVRTTTAE